ncbi:MAG: type II toxin-antitoxin system RelE/ParE family toxin [Treponema sp.]|jgi:proteic killer suppression protein|nr:type II toxin-antitoxin system RelE/ParE family toxin [Treponema sp.]
MIHSFGDKDTEALFYRKRIKKLSPELMQRARSKLLIINAASCENDLRIPPGNRFEKLIGDMKGRYSIRINDQWRITFHWNDGNANNVIITDYH